MSTSVLASRYIHTRVSHFSSGGTRTPRGVHRVVTHALADNVQPRPADTSSKFPQASVYLRRARDVFVAAAVCATLSSQPSLAAEKFPVDSDPGARCVTVACKELYEKVAIIKAAEAAGEPIPNFKMTREERREKRGVERQRMEEQNREFARQKSQFAREERAYLLKYRTMEEEATRLEAEEGLMPREERRARVEAAGARAFDAGMAEQRQYEQDQGEYEDRLAVRRQEATAREAEKAKATATERALKQQEDKYCKLNVCS
eukprot:CAMPEP_0198197682 /NCGR_PEP_ID=MMETSP1445-20131203/1239_1 /TAXON_ID=36898 /ORGANISM="Pyramimonas sp., Strain CCMP2087" /LENGTH=260 /DNA_ID=CAMNT_0043867025 /DNA_START=56 /DNA_END=838 /DNA_ORIENTATION=+